MSQGRFVKPGRALVVVGLIAGVLATTGTGSAVGADEPAVRVLSNRADLVSGGNALVEVVLPAGADEVSVDVDGTDVSDAFDDEQMAGSSASSGFCRGDQRPDRVASRRSGSPSRSTIIRSGARSSRARR